MEVVKFDRVRHAYSINGEALPSVTQVLPEIPAEMLLNQRFIDKTNIGTRVHFACEVLDNDIIGWKPLKAKKFVLSTADLDHVCKKIRKKPDFPYSDLTPEDLPYINAWVKFRNEMNPEIFNVEVRVFSEKFGFAGTVDRVLSIVKKMYVTDIKTSTEVSPSAALQTAGYVLAFKESSKLDDIGRSIVHLLPDGRYAWKPYPKATFAHDVNVFLSKVVSFKWDQENLKRR